MLSLLGVEQRFGWGCRSRAVSGWFPQAGRWKRSRGRGDLTKGAVGFEAWVSGDALCAYCPSAAVKPGILRYGFLGLFIIRWRGGG